MGKFFDWLDGKGSEDSVIIGSGTQSSTTENNTTNQFTNKGTDIQDALSFVTEVQSYYYNDITQMESDLIIHTDWSQSRERYIRKKILQEKIALAQIGNIITDLREVEVAYQSVFKKSIYSFYEDILSAKLVEAQEHTFKIIIRLNEINTKPELSGSIINKLEELREAWNISSEIVIPRNFNAIIVGESDGVEEYHFSGFKKLVLPAQDSKQLSPKQIKYIRNLRIEFDNPIVDESVWVYVTSANRAQLNRLRKTCIIPSKWEYAPNLEGKLCFDIVSLNELENYLKGILQIVLSRTTYAIISIFVPTEQMKRIIGPTYETDGKVVVEKNFKFIYRERSGIYGNNLMTARIDRRYIPETIHFVSFTDFRKAY